MKNVHPDEIDGNNCAVRVAKTGANDLKITTNNGKVSTALQEWYISNTGKKVKASKGHKFAKYIFILDNARKDSGLGVDTWDVAITDKMLEMGYTAAFAHTDGRTDYGIYFLMFVPK